MNKRDLQNKKLDKIGRNLLESAKIRDEEVEKIVAAPQLFNLVKAKIEAEKLQREKTGIFINLVKPNFWNWQKLGLSFALLIVLGIASIIFVRQFSSSKTENSLAEIQSQTVNLLATKSVQADKESFTDRESVKTRKPQTLINKNREIIQKVAFKKNNVNTKKSLPKIKQSVKTEIENDGVFYSLIVGEIPADLKENFNIIRVDMTRSSLIALGVNISPDNENPIIEDRIKTDLLVGFNGIPQAYRFVR